MMELNVQIELFVDWLLNTSKHKGPIEVTCRHNYNCFVQFTLIKKFSVLQYFKMEI